jgi:hypothetical protein
MSAAFGRIYHHVSAPLYGAPTSANVAGNILNGPDPYDGGLFGFSGVVSIAGTPDQPASVKVALFCERSRRLIREVWSAADGAYTFDRIRNGPWFIVAFDPTNTFNAIGVTGVELPLIGNDGINLRFNDTGSSINYYNGSTWVSGRLKRWDGVNWVLV